MEYNISDLKAAVRVAMDRNNSSTALSGLGDVDTLKIEEIIESKIVPAATVIESSAPHHMLDSGRAFGDNISWESQAGYGAGHVHLPDDFLRLVTFQMTDWSYAVTEAITESDPMYQLQHSRYAGVRGTPQKPVVAIVQEPSGLVLEFFTCYTGSNAHIKRARYIPIPKIANSKIDLCEKLKPAIVYYTAYLSAMSLGDGDTATAMLATAKELAQIPSE